MSRTVGDWLTGSCVGYKDGTGILNWMENEVFRYSGRELEWYIILRLVFLER